MDHPGEGVRHWANRAAQLLLDPLALCVPGWGKLMQLGPAGNGPQHVNFQRLSAGLVLLLPGIEGPSLYAANLRAGLAAALTGETGPTPAIEIYNWSGWWPGMCYAFSPRASRRQAGRLIRRIGRYRGQYPGRAVVLVGHSGGGAMAIFTAEGAAAAGAPLDGVIAIAPALGPEYDLTAAVAGVRRQLLICWSRRDYQLRMLTTAGGNFDRCFGRTAGQQGFRRPPREHPERLVQLPWDRSMIGLGHWGGHLGYIRRRWVERYLTPPITEWLTPNREGPDP